LTTMLGDDEKIESMDDILNYNEKEKEPLLANSEYSESSYTPSRSTSPESEFESDSEPADTGFLQPPVSRFNRTFLISLALLCWLAFSMLTNLLNAKTKPKVIHASRYSKEYRFRPAASPVVTETLKDGRTRLRGALPEQTAITPPPVVKKQKRPRAGKAGRKSNSSGTKSKPRAVNQRRK